MTLARLMWKIQRLGSVIALLLSLAVVAMVINCVTGCIGGDGFVLFKGGPKDDKQVLETSGREQDVHRDNSDRGDWDFLEGRGD